jgi:hypothetical protein
MSTRSYIHRRVASLISRRAEQRTPQQHEAVLNELVALYDSIGDEAQAQEVRRAFLLSLEDTPEILSNERFASFVAEHVQPEDFAALRWEQPRHVIEYCEMLYSFSYETDAMAEHVRTLVQNLLLFALQEYERRGDYKHMFQLLQLAPELPTGNSVELLRLRNRAHLYEMRRVQRSRRLLYGYLLAQVVLILFIFPLLFINAENGKLQADAQKAGVELPTKPGEAHQMLSYSDGLYWSLITAASIGYGDITPKTTTGRIIAATLGVLGVITIGVIAGLILDWITVRSIE